MNAHIVRARIRDADALRAAVVRWRSGLEHEREPSRCVVGRSVDAELIAFLVFASNDAAIGASADAPWTSGAGVLVDEPDMLVSDDVDTFLAGVTAEATFLQLVRGRTIDRRLAATLMPRTDRVLARIRPDIVGGHVAWHSNGTFTEVVGFRSAADARAGESAPIPEEDQALMQRAASTHAVDEFLDVPDVWLTD